MSEPTTRKTSRALHLRLFVACGVLSTWLAGLLLGWTLGGAVHLLLLAGLVLVPFRGLRRG